MDTVGKVTLVCEVRVVFTVDPPLDELVHRCNDDDCRAARALRPPLEPRTKR